MDHSTITSVGTLILAIFVVISSLFTFYSLRKESKNYLVNVHFEFQKNSENYKINSPLRLKRNNSTINYASSW